MPQMKTKYIGSLRTEATHIDSGTVIHTDAPKDNQGNGEKFSPTDLLCTALASCKLTIMSIKARSMNVELNGLTVHIQKVMTTSPPRKIAEIILSFHWDGLDKKITAEQLESLKRSALQCPVALSLDPALKQTVNW